MNATTATRANKRADKQAAKDAALAVAALAALPSQAQLDAEEAACRAEEAANLAAEALALAAEPVVKDGYSGPMLALRARMKTGAYQKAPNGQPCCADAVATALGALTPPQVVAALLIALGLPENPYPALNVGQQSMNLRNRMRGALKRGTFGMGVLAEAIEEVQTQDEAATA